MNANLSGLGESEELTTETIEPSPTPELTESTGAEEAPQAAPSTDLNEEATESAETAPVAETHDNVVETDVAETAEQSAAGDANWSGEDVPVAETSEQPAADANWLDQDTSEIKRLKRGDVVEGTITATSPTSVMVDIGMKTEGIIPGRELERMGRETIELLKVGESVPVYVVNPNDHNGDVILSVNRALEEIDWQKAEEYRASQQVYESRVAGYNKGGLIVRFGRVRGFVPQSQLGADRRQTMTGETPEERWGAMVNEAISVKVMEVDRSRNRLILSERTATREAREGRKEALINELAVGEVRTGRVVSLVDFGAFVDIGGAEGLIHLTELSWKHVTHPKDILAVGQKVKVEVINVDRENKRIGLSLKRQEADPWDLVATTYNEGQLVRCIVTKLTKFGAFARLVDLPEIEGLIHISEMSDQRVAHPREVVNEGETLTLRVVKMDIENRRLGLSLKRVNSAEYLDQDWSSFASESQ
jgi:small subunit ribosomal protein S1